MNDNANEAVYLDLIAAAIEEKNRRIAELEADKLRLDFLEGELEREKAIMRIGGIPNSLFRRNMPITRAMIDDAMKEQKQ